MSRYGPAPTTRLVLYAHSLFMDRDGTHCWVGVRRLAKDTGLDKSTVAEHRAAAIAAGAAAPARTCRQHCRTKSRWNPRPCPAPPDSHRTIARRCPVRALALSGLAGQALGRKAGSTGKSTDRDLRQWLERDPRVADYSRDLEALVRMAPEGLRFRGYEEAIRLFVERPR